MAGQISDIRKDYILKSFSEKDALPDPIRQFDRWWKEAFESNIPEVNAMTLATSSADGVPSARIVLLKGFDDEGFLFFTNYNSYKAKQLEENPRACLVFFWKEIERQVRVTGIIEKVDANISEEYFNSRPELSRLSAIASPQSEVIASRDWLEKEVEKIKTNGNKFRRPGHWGGYRVKPITIEFWQGRANRLHDRLQYTLEDTGDWKIERLAP
ncbi:MAG: pyridoxamine 5'-phosphate oxidase [Chitinophagaceae bacterium]|nr:pyridoxamine 5'-phosphate oxidase [Chitinophagaceae bacterium]